MIQSYEVHHGLCKQGRIICAPHTELYTLRLVGSVELGNYTLTAGCGARLLKVVATANGILACSVGQMA